MGPWKAGFEDQVNSYKPSRYSDYATELEDNFESQQEQEMLSSPNPTARHWDPSSLLFNGYRCSFSVVKREVDHSPPSSAKV